MNFYANLIYSERIEPSYGDVSVEVLVDHAKRIEQKFPYFKAMYFEVFLEGKVSIWIPAVYWVWLVWFKVLFMLDLNMKHLSLVKEEDTLKQVFILSSHLSKIFDFLYSSSIDNENDIFYDRSNIKDIKLLLEWLDYSEPKDLDKHKKQYSEGKKFL